MFENCDQKKEIERLNSQEEFSYGKLLSIGWNRSSSAHLKVENGVCPVRVDLLRSTGKCG